MTQRLGIPEPYPPPSGTTPNAYLHNKRPGPKECQSAWPLQMLRLRGLTTYCRNTRNLLRPASQIQYSDNDQSIPVFSLPPIDTLFSSIECDWPPEYTRLTHHDDPHKRQPKPSFKKSAKFLFIMFPTKATENIDFKSHEPTTRFHHTDSVSVVSMLNQPRIH